MLTILIFAKDGEMENDGKGRGVCSEDNKLGDTAVKGLGGLVGALLQLAGICGRC